MAKAGPAASTATYAEALQLDTVSGGAYVSESATSNATGFSTAIISANTTTGVKASAGNVYGMLCANAAASVCYLQFYNSNAPTCGTSVVWSVPLPATPGVANLISPIPMANFATGIGVCIGATQTGAGACGSTGSCTVFYK